MFDVMYGTAFLDGRVGPPRRRRRDRVLPLQHPQPPLHRWRLRGIGAAMFMDTEGTGNLLRYDFQATRLDDDTIKRGFARDPRG
jgi:hypothetical protein